MYKYLQHQPVLLSDNEIYFNRILFGIVGVNVYFFINLVYNRKFSLEYSKSAVRNKQSRIFKILNKKYIYQMKYLL